MISFGQSYTRVYGGINFDVISPHPPLIAPFWDRVDVTRGGTIYYRQDNTLPIAKQIQQDISIQFPSIGFFYPSLVFVATWDRVAAVSYLTNFRGLVNTFQVIIASNGMLTFVRFNYGDIQWGSLHTLIGVSAGDGINFITHPPSLSSHAHVQSLDNTTTTYKVDSKFASYRLAN